MPEPEDEDDEVSSSVNLLGAKMTIFPDSSPDAILTKKIIS